MRYLLDANVLLDFQNASLLPALAKAGEVVRIAVAEKVLDEVTRPGPDDSGHVIGKKREAALALRGARMEVLEIFPGTPEAVMMQALGSLPSGRDQGEAASIAIAASAPDLLFVTGDNKAILWALNEWALNELFHSGERVMRVPVFVRTLLDQGAIDAAALKDVAERAASHGAVPSWWRSWVAQKSA